MASRKLLGSCLVLLMACLAFSTSSSLAAPKPTLYAPLRILSTFEGTDSKGTWWDSDATRVYERTLSNAMSYSGKSSMKIQVHKEGYPWSFFAFHPSQNGVDNNFSGFTEVVFWVYTEKEIVVAAKVTDANGHSSETRITLPAQEWRKGTITLSKNSLDRQSIYNILFFVAPGANQASTTLYVDDLFLVSRDLMADIPSSSLYIPKLMPTTYGEVNACTLHWSQPTKGDWPGAFEIVVADNPELKGPITYWATTNMLVLKELPVGAYFFKIRTWTHLPSSWGYWGNSSPWSRPKQFTIAPIQTVEILDNFDGDSTVSTWWDIDGRDVYVRETTETAAEDGKSSMRVSYRKTDGYEWSYFTANVNINTTFDLSWLDQLIVWIYRDSEEKDFEVLFKLSDAEGHDWTSKATIRKTGSWQKLVLDIPACSINMNRLTSLSFFIDPGRTNISGVFYLDGISLASSRTFLAQPSVVTTALRTTGTYSHELTWTNGRANGAILYQVQEDADTTFHNPITYWTTNTHIDFVKHDAGTWSYQVRAWSHFPEEGGYPSFWSRPVSITHADVPPAIETVTAFFVDDTDNAFPVGAIPRICVYEKNRASDIVQGYISISSSSGKVIKDKIGLVTSENGQYYYAHWSTRGLPPGDYGISATLIDSAGHTATDNKLTIHLEASLPGDISTLLTVVDTKTATTGIQVLPPFTRTYDIRWVHMRGIRPAEKVLGAGWSHNYNALLFEYTDGSVELQWGTGRVDFFVPRGSSYINILHDTKWPELVKNADHSFTAISSYDIMYDFGLNGLLCDLRDSAGNKTLLQYGAHGFLSRIIGPNGEEIGLSYYQNRLVRIVYGDARSISLEYNTNKYLSATYADDGQQSAYIYNTSGCLINVHNINKVYYKFTYNKQGQLVNINKNGEVTTITRYPVASQLNLVFSTGSWATYTLDTWGNVVAIDTPQGKDTPACKECEVTIPGFQSGLK